MTKDFLISALAPPFLFRSVSSDTERRRQKSFFVAGSSDGKGVEEEGGEDEKEKEEEMTEKRDPNVCVCLSSLPLFPPLHLPSRAAKAGANEHKKKKKWMGLLLLPISLSPPPSPRPCYALERRARKEGGERREEWKLVRGKKRMGKFPAIDHLSANSNSESVGFAFRKELCLPPPPSPFSLLPWSLL